MALVFFSSTNRWSPFPFVQLIVKEVEVMLVNERPLAKVVGGKAIALPEMVTDFVGEPVAICVIAPEYKPEPALAFKRACMVRGCLSKPPFVFGIFKTFDQVFPSKDNSKLA